MDIKSGIVNGKNLRFVDIPIQFHGKEENVRMKKISFGDNLEIRQKASKVFVIAGQEKIEINQKVLAEECLLKSIIKAPFDINLANILDMENDIGENLIGIYHELNGFTDKKKEI